MTSWQPSPTVAPDPRGDWHARLRQTATFRDGGFARWAEADIAVFGGGAVGGPLATGVVRSGASVGIFDFDIGAAENQGTQLVEVGISKVDTLVAACDAIAAGRARGFCCDVRHAGIGVLDQFDLFVDTSDDPNLALPLTELSNGLGKPLLRCALDGSGKMELGRVLCSSAATGHACQLCSFDIEDLRTGRPRTACPDQAPPARRPTIAGGAMAMAVAGLGLLSAQRLVTGNDAQLVYGRETVVDFTNIQLLPIALHRSHRCVSGHCRWRLNPLQAAASSLTLSDLFAVAGDQFLTTEITLEPYLHALNVQAECACGAVVDAVGTNWCTPPACPRCRQPMTWCRAVQHARVSPQLAADLGILTTPLTVLGLPDRGAMIIGRARRKPPVRYVLAC